MFVKKLLLFRHVSPFGEMGRYMIEQADLEEFLKNTCDELDWFKMQAEEEEDFKAKLEQLRKRGIIDENTTQYRLN